MSYFIFGLGNPGEKYKHSRHSVGQFIVREYHKEKGAGEWKEDKKKGAVFAEGTVSGEHVYFVLPLSFMNESGQAARSYVKNKNDAAHTVLVHDDVDLPVGVVKISFGRGSGGHRGVESVISALKTKNFFRIRIGVSPKSASGKIKKVRDHEKMKDFVLGETKKNERDMLKSLLPYIFDTLTKIISGEIKPKENTLSQKIPTN